MTVTERSERSRHMPTLTRAQHSLNAVLDAVVIGAHVAEAVRPPARDAQQVDVAGAHAADGDGAVAAVRRRQHLHVAEVRLHLVG